MRVGRLILIVATLLTILVFPLLIKDAIQALRLPSAYAAPNMFDSSGRVYQNGNTNDNGNTNNDNRGGNNDDDDNDNRNGNNDNDDESDNEGEEDDGNDNVECFANLNSNEEVPCDFEDNGNQSDGGRHSGESLNRPTKCFDAREVGVVQLGTGNFDVTVQVMPHSSFNQTTRLTLKKVDAPGAISGGTLVDSVVYELRAQSSCDGVDIGTLPNLANMGITYNVTGSVDKAKLQIVRWTGSAWENVDTVPDPVAGNPYVSATVSMAGTYALIQKP
jgi:hypothetical protein